MITRCRRRAVASATLLTFISLTPALLPVAVLHAQTDPPPTPVAVQAVGFAVSAPLAEIAAAESPAPFDPSEVDIVIAKPIRTLPGEANADPQAPSVDEAVQAEHPGVHLIPEPGLASEGLSSNDNAAAFGFRLSPPDTVGDVGPNHYVQMVNLLVRVYNKAGAPLTPPFKLSSLFGAVGGACAARDDGDPIVLYDPLADRWLLSQFCTVNDPFPHQMVALSKSSDPTGQYYLYDFRMPNGKFNDYPKFGVWSDAYYMTDNQFNPGFVGTGVFAFSRAKMLAGDPTASYIYFDLATNKGGMLPADLDGLTPPPLGQPAYFAQYQSAIQGEGSDGMRIFEFHADFANPASSTFALKTVVPVAAFDPRSPAGRNDIEQPPPAPPAPAPSPLGVNYLDSIQDRLMFRLAYRNFGSHESLVTTHTVNVSGVVPTTSAIHRAGVRYYEFRRNLPGGSFFVKEGATFAPDADNRWMGSAAMDTQGNLAVGYSVSSLTTFPSVRYAGRLATDPPTGLFQGETTVAAGTGVQRSTGGRWGDYSAMSVDPADDCTFWYTTEYYTAASQNTSVVGWLTKIGKFKFPGCTAPALGTIQGSVTNSLTSAPVPFALLQMGPFSSGANAAGAYSRTLPPSSYAMTASLPNWTTASATATVTGGGVTTQDFQISPSGADVFVAQSAPASSGGGAPITYALSVGNNGPLPATNVALTNPIPAGALFASITTSQGSCSSPPFGGSGVVSCDIGPLAVGASVALSLTLHGTIATGSITNVASVSAAEPDDITTNNTSSASTAVACAKTVRGGPFGAPSPDHPSTHGFQVGRLNRNGVASACATPKATPPPFGTASLAFDAYTLTNPSSSSACITVSLNGAACTVPAPPPQPVQPNSFVAAYLGSFDPNNVTANYLGDPGVSSTGTASFSFVVPGNGTFVVVVNEVLAGGGCASYSFNVDGLPCPLADVSVSKTAPGLAVTGSSVPYSVAAACAGPNEASGLVFSDVLPATLAFQTLASTPGWSCTAPPVGGSGTLSCTKPSMGAGEDALLDVTATLSCALPDGAVVTNGASIVAASPGDPVPTNNGALASVIASNPPPLITPPPALVVATGPGSTSCGRLVSDAEIGVATVADNCPGASLSRSGVPAGNVFPLGTTTLGYSSIDSGGASSSATQTITVVDDTPPLITGASVDTPLLWPPNHRLVDVFVGYGLSDNCGATAAVLSVTSNEPVNANGDGNTAPDWVVVDAHHVQLRAERAGGGSGRVYTITIATTDVNGNSSVQNVEVRVPHSQKK